MIQNSVDVAVVGGGPAGSIAAAKLAQDGLSVTLIDPAKSRQRIEGIGDRLIHWLDTEGLAEPLKGMSVYVPRVATWNGEVSDHNHEHLVERSAFDALLRDHAAASGASVIEDAGRIVTEEQGLLVALSDGPVVRPRYIIDARGRAAHVGRKSLRGPATVAIGGWLKDAPDRPASAMVCPIPEGWVWMARLGNGHTWIQATLDPHRKYETPEIGLMAAMASAAKALPDCPQTLPNGLLVRECAPVISLQDIDPRVLPVGDAAAGMDPLSGHGMFWAVSSALAAVAAIKTMEQDASPGAKDLVQRFMGERNRETYWRQARLGRDFLRQEYRYQDQPFWQKRLNFPDDQDVHAPASLEMKRTIIVEDGILVEQDVLITPQEPSGVAWVAGVPIVEAYGLVQNGAGEAALISRWGAEGRMAYGWLVQRLQP